MNSSKVVDFDDYGPTTRLEMMLQHGAARYPSKTAVRYLEGGAYRQISYDQLRTRVHCLASILQPTILTHNSCETLFVGLFLSRSVARVVAIFASFLAGAAYAPISFDAPISTFQCMVDQTRMRVILIDSIQLSRLEVLEKSNHKNIVVINISKLNVLTDKPSPIVYSQATASNPAHVLFSSGITGAWFQMRPRVAC